jgi:hypothetical protein
MYFLYKNEVEFLNLLKSPKERDKGTKEKNRDDETIQFNISISMSISICSHVMK